MQKHNLLERVNGFSSEKKQKFQEILKEVMALGEIHAINQP
jgi:hypothetical protein